MSPQIKANLTKEEEEAISATKEAALAAFEALLEAKGMDLGGGGRGRAQPGRKLSYFTKVQFNGNLMVGSAYTAQLGLKPGDQFEIKLGRGQITLDPIDNPSEA